MSALYFDELSMNGSKFFLMYRNHPEFFRGDYDELQLPHFKILLN